MTPATYWCRKLFKSEAMGELVRIDLINSYSIAEDWETRDALRKVIEYYSNPSQYKEFGEKCDEG